MNERALASKIRQIRQFFDDFRSDANSANLIDASKSETLFSSKRITRVALFTPWTVLFPCFSPVFTLRFPSDFYILQIMPQPQFSATGKHLPSRLLPASE